MAHGFLGGGGGTIKVMTYNHIYQIMEVMMMIEGAVQRYSLSTQDGFFCKLSNLDRNDLKLLLSEGVNIADFRTVAEGKSEVVFSLANTVTKPVFVL